jgi:7-carboxy-7-deazaguanine synthase
LKTPGIRLPTNRIGTAEGFAAMRYPIHEVFHSWQGEGSHAGRSAFFIRTFGCPVHCPWCDSAGTWHPDKIPEKIDRWETAALVEAAVVAAPDFVVITGGEPAIHDLRPLTEALHGAGLPVHLETSGAFRLRGTFDWVTLSPKRWRLPLPEALAAANEFKLILESPAAFDEYWPVVAPFAKKETPVWLHPEWSCANDRALLAYITDLVKERGAPLRAGWQLHKLYAADAQDPRARDADEASVPSDGRRLDAADTLF